MTDTTADLEQRARILGEIRALIEGFTPPESAAEYALVEIGQKLDAFRDAERVAEGAGERALEGLRLAFDAGWTAGRGAGSSATYDTKKRLRDESLSSLAAFAAAPTPQPASASDRREAIARGLIPALKDALRGKDKEEEYFTDAGMDDAFFRWPVIERELRAILAALTPDAGEDVLAEREWQRIETAPEVKGKYFFCRIAWGPEWDKCTGDGFRWKGKWFVAALFHKGSARFDECQNEFRQIEVSPTHWMPKPEVPVQQDIPRTAAQSPSADNSELEPDGRQEQPGRSADRQGSAGGEVGGCPSVLAGGVQRGECDVRSEDGQHDQLNEEAGASEALASSPASNAGEGK
jgi:hypothetical protein